MAGAGELTCGGCKGLGSHTRWCREQVGVRASILGLHAERAEALADAIGASHVKAANRAYLAAAMLRDAAVESRNAWQRR